MKNFIWVALRYKASHLQTNMTGNIAVHLASADRKVFHSVCWRTLKVKPKERRLEARTANGEILYLYYIWASF